MLHAASSVGVVNKHACNDTKNRSTMNAPLSVPFKMKQSLKESEQAQEYRSGGQTHLTFANNVITILMVQGV